MFFTILFERRFNEEQAVEMLIRQWNVSTILTCSKVWIIFSVKTASEAWLECQITFWINLFWTALSHNVIHLVFKKIYFFEFLSTSHYNQTVEKQPSLFDVWGKLCIRQCLIRKGTETVAKEDISCVAGSTLWSFTMQQWISGKLRL